MACLQDECIDVEVKVFRGEPRIYIRYQNNKPSKKGNVKSLTCEEWQILKNSTTMIDQQLLNLKKGNDSLITRTDCENSGLNTTFNITEPSQSEPETVNYTPNYFVDEQAVADLLAILQRSEQQQGINLPSVI